MIDYISETRGYTRQQAYIIASVAVDLRIGQLVDGPNVGVTAILPLEIFEQRQAGRQAVCYCFQRRAGRGAMSVTPTGSAELSPSPNARGRGVIIVMERSGLPGRSCAS